MAMDYKIANSGYSDVLMHMHDEPVEGSEVGRERTGFPITRYDSLLNRPRVIYNAQQMPVSNFHLLATEEGEISDDKVYEMFGQIW